MSDFRGWSWQIWRADHKVSALSAIARCCWFEWLGCIAEDAESRGQLSGPPEVLAKWARVSEDEVRRAIDEIAAHNVADVTRHGNGDVTLVCRKMRRDAERIESRRESGRTRVRRHRERVRNAIGNAGETQPVTLAVPPAPSPSHTLPLTPPPSAQLAPQAASATVGKRPSPASSVSSAGGAERTPSVGDAGADGTPIVIVYPCAVGVRSKGRWFALTAGQVAAWGPAFPAIDVLTTCRRARTWCDANPRNLKTAESMARWLTGVWLTGDQNNAPALGERRDRGNSSRRRPSAEERGEFPEPALALPDLTPKHGGAEAVVLANAAAAADDELPFTMG